MHVARSKFIAILLFAVPAAFALRMDETTHDEVIKRLEMGLDSMDKSEPERGGILIRLADLYADRARLKAMNDTETRDSTGKAPKDDRARSIRYYTEALPLAPREKQGRIVLQLAHLHNLNEESAKAIRLYNDILKSGKSKYSSEVKGLAYSSLGDIYFRKGDFKTALHHFQSAKREALKNRGLVEYRIAWCLLNLGRTDKATKTLVDLLKRPELMTVKGEDGEKSADTTFHQDVSNDLAKFLARGNVRQRDLQLLRDLSPDNARKHNLHTLGTETDRLGKKAAALVVWAAYLSEGDVQPTEKIEVQARVAQIFYDMNKSDAAAETFEKATEVWRKHGCHDPELCGELRSRLRKMVTAWNKSQKKRPTTNLFRVYLAYTGVFTDDTEMTHWAAVVGSDLKRHQEAMDLFHRAAILAQNQLRKDPQNKSLRNIVEGSLLGEIEMAEASQDMKAREAAYNFYLNINPNGEKAFEVRYQRAQVFSHSDRHQEAFSEFHYLASMPGKDKYDLKIKSADLALDSLVALKDDKNLQVRSIEYARLFPERKTEYLKISRKATMTMVATRLKDEGDSDRSDYKANLAALNQVNLDGADDGERIRFYKNKILIAQKALDFGVVIATASHLLAVRSLNDEDKEWAMAQEVWAAELQLDFAQAYKLSKQMKLPRISKADRELRLALLADLAGLNSRPHNENYLRLVGPGRAANLVRVTLVKTSPRPWAELGRHVRYLKQTPDLLAGVALEVFARDRDFKKAGELLKSSLIVRYPAGKTLARHLELREFQAFDRKIRSHRIQSISEYAMQKSLKERLSLLRESEKLAKSAFQRQDWTLQVLSLTQMARENRRLFHDIRALPIPRRLNKEQRSQYMQMIQAQSQPYLDKAEKFESDLAGIWNNSNSVQNLQTAYMTASNELQRLYRDEISGLAQSAPSRAQNRLRDLLNTPYRRPSQKDILTARRALQTDPLNVSKAESLRELESQGGNVTMVVYLDERIAQLKKGKTL
jgi:tetratricopeptide (TPR) repeat protein